MPTCNQCGEQIEFRYVNGRCIPIHPGGGWHCGSFASTGHTTTIRVSRAGEWQVRDFTRPTKCPTCGENVFFIRHNGGSVWVDELGWPWPKHGCFDQPNEPTQKFSLWAAKSSGLTNPKLAIITRIKEDQSFGEPILEIRFTDSSRASLILRYTPSTSSLLGALVIISKEDSLLIHQRHAEIAFHSFTPLVATDGNGYYACPRCKAWVNENSGHDEYCRKHHSDVAPSLGSNSKGVTKRPGGPAFRSKPLEHRGPAQQMKPAPPSSPTPTPNASMPSKTPETVRPTVVTLVDRIKKAVETVAVGAWASVRHVESADEQLRLAKQQALKSIGMLSPSIRRQVEHRFTSEKWKPLLTFQPKE